MGRNARLKRDRKAHPERYAKPERKHSDPIQVFLPDYGAYLWKTHTKSVADKFICIQSLGVDQYRQITASGEVREEDIKYMASLIVPMELASELMPFLEPGHRMKIINRIPSAFEIHLPALFTFSGEVSELGSTSAMTGEKFRFLQVSALHCMVHAIVDG